MAGADLVHGHRGLGETLRQRPGRPGVVQVDVRNHDPVEMVDAGGIEAGQSVLEGALRARLDQGRLLATDDEDGGHLLVPVHLGIDDDRPCIHICHLTKALACRDAA